MLEAANRLGWREDIARAIAGSPTAADAGRALHGWADAENSGAGGLLVDLLHESAARAWMAGQLMVRDVEMTEPRVSLSVPLGTDDAFLSLPFELALRRFLEREVMDPDDAFDALGRIRDRAFSARRLAVDSVRQTAFDSLVSALADGETVDEFIESIWAEERSLGISPTGHGYLRTVFETNVVSAYSAGRDEQLTQPEVIDALPFRIYRAVVDGRTRASHAALDGKAWDARETDEWRRFQGPNSFNCRCQVVSAFEASKAALARPAVHPDASFDQAPTLAL